MIMRKTPSHTEKKMVYSIRSLKNGTGSVLIGASLVLLAMATPTISANEATTASAEATNTITQPLTDTAVKADKKESDISLPKNANAFLEKTEEKPATEATTPAASPADSAPQIGQDRSSEPTTSTSPVTTETKAEEPIINNTAGKNLTGDKSAEKLAPKMNEAWLDQDYKVFSYEPQPAGTIRVNYYRTDGNYDKKSLWYWGDVKNPSSAQWPDGTDFTATGKYGRYIDIPLKDAAKEFGFLLLDESKQGDDVKIRKEDYKFTDLKNHSQIFLKDDDH